MIVKALQHMSSKKVRDSCILADEAKEAQATWRMGGRAMEVGFH